MSLRAAARKVKITPSNLKDVMMQGYNQTDTCYGKASLESDIFARILVLEADKSRVVIVAVDSCLANWREFMHFGGVELTPPFPKHMREQWAKAAGTPWVNVFLTATHTHSAPTIFGGDKIQQPNTVISVSTAIEAAVAKLEPVTLSLHTGYPRLAKMRRNNLINKDNNLDPREPRFPGDNWYQVDDTMTVLKIQKNNSENSPPLALLVNYGAHPTLWGNPRYLSPDFPGEAMSYVERSSDTVSLFMQGCCGDISPPWPPAPGWSGNRADYITSVETIGKYLAGEIMAAAKTPGTVLPAVNPKGFIYFPPLEENLFKKEYQPYRNHVDLSVSGLRIAENAMLIGAAGELFSDYRIKIGKWVKESARTIEHTLVGSIVNGYAGYLPTALDYDTSPKASRATLSGSYEMQASPYTVGIESQLKAMVKEVVTEIMKGTT